MEEMSTKILAPPNYTRCNRRCADCSHPALLGTVIFSRLPSLWQKCQELQLFKMAPVSSLLKAETLGMTKCPGPSRPSAVHFNTVSGTGVR